MAFELGLIPNWPFTLETLKGGIRAESNPLGSSPELDSI
jgi:hypothetical protein